MIEIEGLNKHFGKLHVLNQISLSLKAPECIALIGPNGSGKTTLIKSILRMVIPDQGDIMVNGIDTSSSVSYREEIGYMPQMSRLPENMRVEDLFDMIKKGRTYKNDFDNDLYDKLDIKGMEGKPLGALSGGMRQKVSAALAFLFDPKVLILDEPTSALDPVANEILKEKIKGCKAKGKLVLITSHNLNDLDGLIDRVIYLMDGKVHFNRSLDELSSLTGRTRLNEMIVHMLKASVV